MAPKSPEFSSVDLAKLPEIRTLVLDDSSFDRKRICRMGNGLDLKLRIEEATSVQGLKECLDRQNFDLFLIDYKMPGSDGLSALDVIRNHKSQSGAVSIMISGQADQRIAVSAMKNGCQDFIMKSDISPDYLQGTVLSALSGSRQFSRYFGDLQARGESG
ncbi:response regulator [Novosphingobium sp. MW5]|nr:response regulator [Novosphingobium sp. MW5]